MIKIFKNARPSFIDKEREEENYKREKILDFSEKKDDE